MSGEAGDDEDPMERLEREAREAREEADRFRRLVRSLVTARDVDQLYARLAIADRELGEEGALR